MIKLEERDAQRYPDVQERGEIKENLLEKTNCWMV